MKKLDRKRYYAQIHGHSVARYYQDGTYFNGRGDPVTEEEAAKPAGLSQRQMEELRNENIDSDESLAGDESSAVPEAEVAAEATPSPPPSEPEADPAPEPEEDVTEDEPAEEEAPAEEKKDPVVEGHYEDMVKLHHTAVTAMAEDLKAQMIADGADPDTLSEIPFSGEGAKKKNARWVAEHIE